MSGGLDRRQHAAVTRYYDLVHDPARAPLVSALIEYGQDVPALLARAGLLPLEDVPMIWDYLEVGP